MRFLVSLLFVLSIPIIVFIATILTGGISEKSVKTTLSTSGAYALISSQITGRFIEQQDPVSQIISSVVEKRLTNTFLQGKIEGFVDDSFAYIKGKSDKVPAISFSEIKDDIEEKSPGLLNSLTATMSEMQSKAGGEEAVPENAGADGMKKFIENDFSISVGDKLKNARSAYFVLKIAFPILILLDALYLFLLVRLSKTLKEKLLWIGIPLLVAAGYGYLYVAGGKFLIDSVYEILIAQENIFVRSATPVVIDLATGFIAKYRELQTTLTLVFGVAGVTAIAAAFFPKKKTVKKKS